MKTKTEPKNTSWKQNRKQQSFWLPLLLLCLVGATCPAQSYTILHEFPSRDWSWADGTLVVSGGTIYGTTEVFGVSNKGTIFALGTNGTGFTVIKDFTGGDDGDTPLGLVRDGNTLYGATCFGGTSDMGTLFRLNTDGSGFAVLKDFLGYPGDGSEPTGGLVLSGDALYGTTMYAGDYIFGGTVFQLNTNGGGYAVLKSFTGSEGAYPNNGLVMVDSMLVGTTGGGGENAGNIFKLNSDGSSFAVLRSFSNGDNQGYDPEAGLVASGTNLFGTTTWLGTYGYGSVYKLGTNGSGYRVLKEFVNPSEGMHPQSVLLCAGGLLFGTTYFGGISDQGVIFQMNADGSGFTVLKHFLGADGADPNSALVIAGRTLYGMTSYGGGNDGGVVFALSLPVLTLEDGPRSQTAEIGATVNFACQAIGIGALGQDWYLNGTNYLGSTDAGGLLITNAQPQHCGVYQVVVRDAFGSVTSAPVALNVIAPVERRSVPALLPSGETGQSLNLEYTDALSPSSFWLPIATVKLANPPQWYFDLTTPLPPQRFYRGWQSGQSSVAPTLTLPAMVPAITLTGSIGGSVRVDCINRLGPIDAWVTLDTVSRR